MTKTEDCKSSSKYICDKNCELNIVSVRDHFYVTGK